MAAEIEGVHCADNLEFLRSMPDACVDLIYIDPPFATGITRRLQSIRLGRGKKQRTGFGDKSYQWEVVSNHAYNDSMPMEDYVEFLGQRLAEMHRVLKPTGSLYLHLDFHAAHYGRILMDEIFGAEHFLNEIIWAYDFGGRAKDKWPRKHDNILWYAKSDTWTFNREAIERIPYMAPGLVGEEKAARGKLPTDVWWMTIVPTNGHEKTGYPTQKPLKLLQRIVTASSHPGDLVADFFGGSGTTAVAAKEAGRRFLHVDVRPAAVEIARSRLAEPA